MTQVTVHQAKTQLSSLLAEVEAGHEVVIARGNKPVARLVAVTEKPKRQPVSGTLKGKVSFDERFFEPLPDEELGILAEGEGAGVLALTRLLLDTHAVIWWSIGSSLLSRKAAEAIGSPDTLKMVSAASAWEIATKHRLGKLPEADLLARDLDSYLYDQGFEALDVTVAHGRLGGALPSPHRDPFDRLLIAQALLERLTFVSNETVLDGFGVPRIW